jgi:hypothetical protein
LEALNQQPIVQPTPLLIEDKKEPVVAMHRRDALNELDLKMEDINRILIMPSIQGINEMFVIEFSTPYSSLKSDNELYIYILVSFFTDKHVTCVKDESFRDKDSFINQNINQKIISKDEITSVLQNNETNRDSEKVYIIKKLPEIYKTFFQPIKEDVNKNKKGGVGRLSNKYTEYEENQNQNLNQGFPLNEYNPNFQNRYNRGYPNSNQNQMYQNQMYSNQMYSNQMYSNYNPNQFQGYPNQNPNYNPNQFQGYRQQIDFTHNMQFNIDRERKSKLSYYIEIELELFPGTQINTLQKYSVKCQTTFERIREAWADIFGFQYRPGVQDEAYAYQAAKPQVETRRDESRIRMSDSERRKNEPIRKNDEPERRRRGGTSLKKHSKIGHKGCKTLKRI